MVWQNLSAKPAFLPKRRQASSRIETTLTAVAMTTCLTLGPRLQPVKALGYADSVAIGK